MTFTPDIEIQADDHIEHQEILAGLAEINRNAEVFSMSFEQASEYTVDQLESQIAQLERRLEQVRSAIPNK